MVKHRYVSLWIFLAVFLLLTVFMVTQAGIVKADSPEGSEPPAFQSTPYQMSQELGTRWIDIYIDPVNEAYYDVVLLPDGATPPSKEQVVAGTDGDGNPALDSINIKFKTTGTNVRVYAEKHSTDYDIYVVLRDDAGNLSEPAMLDVVSPQGAQYIMPDGISWFKEEDGSRQILVDVRLQNINPDYKGKVYWVLLPMGAEEPIIDQIAAGTDGAGNPAVSMGSPEFDPSEGSGQFIATGAAGDTTYNLYLVVGNTENYYPLSRCTEVQQLSVTTPPDIPDEKVCEMNGTQYGKLAEALNEVDSTATIKLLKSLTTVESVIINKKHITFDLNGHVLNIHTAADEGLKVTEGTVSLEGEGELNVTGRLYGVSADLQSSVTVTNAAASNTDVSDSATSVGVLAQKGSEVTVRGNATGTDHGIRAENIYTEVTVEGDVTNNAQGKAAVHSAGQAVVLVKGNVTNKLGYGVYSYSGKITVEKDVYGSHVGAMAEGVEPEIHIKGDLGSGNNGAVIRSSSNGVIIVEGEIKGSDSRPSPAVSYISFGSTILAKEDGVADPAMPGYLKYSSSGTSTVWVKDPMAASIWEVSNASELENALENFEDGDTIKLTADIDYNKGIVIDGKTVTFDVGTNNLNVHIDAPDESNNGLLVKNGGHLLLNGTGQFNISLVGDNTSTGVRVEAGSSAVVTNIGVTVEKGSAFGAYAYGNGADIHVLGNIRVLGEGGCGGKTSGRGKITVDGVINASVYINIGSNYKDKSSGVEDPDKPGYLKYSTPPNETGIIWVRSEDAVTKYTLLVENGTGSGDYEVEADVTITANDAPDGQRFKEWSITPSVSFVENTSKFSQTSIFIMPAQPVVATAIYEAIPAPEYTITIQTDDNGTASANLNSAAKGTEITLTTTANGGYKFKEWQVISGGVTITDNRFTMPAANVTLKAIFEAIPAPIYTITIQDDGNGTAAANLNSAAKGTEITLTTTANNGYKFKEWQVVSGDVTITDNRFIMPAANVTLKAIFSESTNEIPKTGDSNNPWVWFLLCGISVVGIGYLILLKKRNKAEV
jgi:LPXTG-motif cell wall-anchored protein